MMLKALLIAAVPFLGTAGAGSDGYVVTATPVVPVTQMTLPTYISAWKGGKIIDRLVVVHEDGSYKCLRQPSPAVMEELEDGAMAVIYISLCGKRVP